MYSHSGPFASIFVDVSRDAADGAHEVELQARDACSQLGEQGASDTVVDRVATLLATPPHQPAPVSRAVVATADEVVFDEITRARATKPSALWADLPDVTTWIMHEDGAIPFAVAVVDHEGGDIATYQSSTPDPAEVSTAGGDDEHEHKVRGGGMAHMRYQRTAENVWAKNAGLVAEGLRSRIADGLRLVFIAGEPDSRSKVTDGLASLDGVEVIELDHGGRARDGGDEAMHEQVADILAEHAAARRLETAHALEDRLGRGQGAVTGVADVAEAFVRGQVQALLIDPSEAADLEVVPGDHPGFPVDEVPTREPLRADLALIAAAARTGSEIVVMPSRALSGAPVAALLRWEQTS